jgi:RNA recognition motif-containing protein
VKTKLYVGNLPFSLTEEDFKEMFEAYGEVKSANIIVDRYSNQSRGFGFIDMDNPDSAAKALEETNGKEVSGRELKVSFAKEDRQRRDPRNGNRSRPFEKNSP